MSGGILRIIELQHRLGVMGARSVHGRDIEVGRLLRAKHQWMLAIAGKLSNALHRVGVEKRRGNALCFKDQLCPRQALPSPL